MLTSVNGGPNLVCPNAGAEVAPTWEDSRALRAVELPPP